MKKLSTLIALALVITIGGVFAAWHYSIGAVDSLQIGPGLQMTTVETSSETAKGKIDQVSAHNFTFRVDDTYDYNKTNNPGTESDDQQYLAMLTGSGSWVIKFTPNDNVSLDIQQNGINLVCTVTVTGSELYDGKVILSAISNGNTISLGRGLENKTITAEQILGCLDFVDDVVLDTPEKNATFAAALAKYTINITITEAVA